MLSHSRSVPSHSELAPVTANLSLATANLSPVTANLSLIAANRNQERYAWDDFWHKHTPGRRGPCAAFPAAFPAAIRAAFPAAFPAAMCAAFRLARSQLFLQPVRSHRECVPSHGEPRHGGGAGLRSNYIMYLYIMLY